MSLLEVIALTADDARAAQDGGADRLEVVADMAADGLTPDPDVVAAVRKATTLPIRVMLRANAGFGTSGGELDRLRGAAADLADAGADGFVFGFLDASGHVDTGATGKLAADAAPLPWTFHRALDNSDDPGHAWEVVRGLGGGLDTVLTAGSARGVDAGVDVLVRRAAESPEAAKMIMAGGGLRRKHVAVLAAAGITAFHVGTAVRPDGAWDAPVDPTLVREWRSLVSAAAG
ncbi:copper homeostasis protein [Actinomadura pelletieri DSM 43383]|uniref:Copper homeostasis protein cutC homolog n=1 Tax=Actinomadura pelletieri DSM 43383 TaxID=1120940 RepID=A0A495QNU5_9ACTN|nr:copper homeostasis protein CutC [Actinomadura pelletieri]RKS74634.1 copper homeostasis protein [Actinomadura pelletieri DSM 43383]